MKVGFIGFGGAAHGLSMGLVQAGLTEISFFDSLLSAPVDSEIILRRAEETGAIAEENLEALIQDSEIIVSCVTGAVALTVAEQAAALLTQDQLYVDVNTASPGTMEAVGEIIEKTGARFADVAMMGGIPAFSHRVPCLASGNGAQQFQTAMQPYGMDITCVGLFPGQASAIKMFRSIFMKGFLAILLEMLTATHRYQVDSIVLDSIAKTMEKNTFTETVRLQMAKGVINAKRMAHEMEAVAETLAEMSLPSTMASATKDKLSWCGNMKLAEHLGGEMSQSLDEILDILIKKI